MYCAFWYPCTCNFINNVPSTFCKFFPLNNLMCVTFYVVFFSGIAIFLFLLCFLGTLIDQYHQYRISHIPKLVHRIDSSGELQCFQFTSNTLCCICFSLQEFESSKWDVMQEIQQEQMRIFAKHFTVWRYVIPLLRLPTWYWLS